MLDDPRTTLDRLATKPGLLREAYERDPKLFHVVGGFVTGPTLSEEQVSRIEGESGLVLPQEYRAFLLRLGDAGTGPGNAFCRFVDAGATKGEPREVLIAARPVLDGFTGADDVDPFLVAAIVAHDTAYFADAGPIDAILIKP